MLNPCKSPPFHKIPKQVSIRTELALSGGRQPSLPY